MGHRFVTTGGTVTLRVTATISAVETGSIVWVVQGLAAAAAVYVPRNIARRTLQAVNRAATY